MCDGMRYMAGHIWGFNMVLQVTKYGLSYGLSMDYLWIIYGLSMDYLWIIYDY